MLAHHSKVTHTNIFIRSILSSIHRLYTNPERSTQRNQGVKASEGKRAEAEEIGDYSHTEPKRRLDAEQLTCRESRQ